MKKAVYLASMFVFCGISARYERVTEYVSCTIKNEKRLRKMLYRVYEAHPHFYRANTCEFFEHTDFFIEILKAHIEKIEKKIANPHVFSRSKAAGEGCFTLGLSAFCGVVGYLVFPRYPWPKKADFIQGNWYYRKKHSDAENIYVQRATMLPFLSCLFAVIAMHKFYKFSTSAKLQVDYLQRDKLLLAFFEKKKREQDAGR